MVASKPDKQGQLYKREFLEQTRRLCCMATRVKTTREQILLTSMVA